MAAEGPIYRDRFARDSEIMVGKPVIAGTRMPVELVLAHLAYNPDLDDLFGAYPNLTREDVQAALAYAQAVVEAEGKRRSLIQA